MMLKPQTVTANSGQYPASTVTDMTLYPSLIKRTESNNTVCSFVAYGVFSSATFKLQGSMDGVTWVDVTSAAITADGNKIINERWLYYRVSWTGGAGAVNVKFALI